MARDLELLIPPAPVRGADLGPRELPEAWQEGKATLAELATALSGRRGHAVPWVLLHEAVTEALGSRLFEVVDQGSWPCGPDDMERVQFQMVEVVEVDPAELISSDTQEVWKSPAPTLGQLKENLEATRGRALPEDVFRSAVENALSRGLFALADPTVQLPSGEAISGVRIRRSKASLFAEAQLSAQQLQDFAAIVPELKRAAPELDFVFRVTLTAEGEESDEDGLTELNRLLRSVSEKLRFD